MTENMLVVDPDAQENSILPPSADETTETSEEAGDPAPFDMDEFRRTLEQITQETVSRTEFESVKRQAGQTRALQRKIDALERQLAERPSDVVSREEYDALVSLLEDILPDDRREILNRTRSTRTAETVVKQQFTDFEKRIFERLGIKDDSEQQETEDKTDLAVVEAALTAAWQTATQAVSSYAERMGVTLTKADYDEAQRAAGPYAPDKAVELMVEKIQARARSGTRESRIAERKAAASGGVDDRSSGPRDGSQGKYDLSTLSGLAKARRAGAIDSNRFFELYQQLNRDAGR